MELLWPNWIQLLLAVVLLAGCIVLILRKNESQWFERFRVAAGFVIVLLLFVFLFLAFNINATTHSALAISPDGAFVARTIVWRGTALDYPEATVIVRRHWSPYWQYAYEGLWWGDADGGQDPHLHWIGPRRLVLEYPNEKYTGECKQSVLSIEVECKAVLEQ